MVETSLHPRPCFHRFLQADSRREGDALTYYDYQRALRSKKVEILQQRRAVTYEPGYKKPCAVHPAKLTRKVFQLKNNFPVPSAQIVKSPPLIKPNEGVKFPVEPAIEQLHTIESLDSSTNLGPEAAIEPNQGKTTVDMMEGTSVQAQAQTDRLPKIYRKPRLVKSATTVRDSSLASTSAIVSPPLIPQRPKTVASTRDSQIQTQEGLQLPQKGCRGGIGVSGREELCKSYQWGTTTQRNYDDVKWAKRYSLPSSFLPTTTVEQFPDPVSQKLTFRRYNSEPAGWQTFGNQWDYFQTRDCDTFIKGPQAIAFCSSCQNTQQIPGYSGYLPGLGKFDEDKQVSLTPLTLIRTMQPRKTKVSRRANIPGYAGQVHWTNTSPAHSNMPIPEPTSTARVHRYIPLEDELSPFRKEAVLARMVTTVSPYNPFNKIQY